MSEGLFYTEKCFKSNFNFSINGIPIHPKVFKTLKEIKKSQVDIRLSGKTVTLNYDGKQFFAQEGDAVKSIIELVKKACKYAINIIVSKIDNQAVQKLMVNSVLKSSDKYIIKSDFKFRFKSLTGSDSPQILDYTSTVSDCKNQLSLIYGCNPSCIVIYNDNKDKITDLTRQLNTIPNYAKLIYFDIDREIKKSQLSPSKS